MKNILLGLLMLVSSLIYSQTDSTYRNLSTTLDYVVNTSRPKAYINLSLGVNKNKTVYTNDASPFTGYIIFISGITFVAATLLEDPYTYSTFWQQTPRQIMFCVGIGLTLSGGIDMVYNK